MKSCETPSLQTVYELHHITPGLTLCVVDLNAFAAHCLGGIELAACRYQKNRLFGADDIPFSLFSARELERINAFRTLKKQVEWMGGRFAVKTLVAAAEGAVLDPASVEIAYHPKGAPYLKHRQGWHISISHSHDYAVAALSCRAEIDLALDLEKIEERNLKFLMKVAFTQREKQHLLSDDYATIYRNWTIKEAYLKYLKEGFHENLQKVEIIEGRLYHERKPVSGLKILSSRIREGYAFTLLYPSGK